jgi:hypothetical protein
MHIKEGGWEGTDWIYLALVNLILNLNVL